MRIATGAAAAILAACTGAGWQLLTRHGVSTSLDPLDIAVLRYGIPAAILLPLLRRVGLRPQGIGWTRLALLVGGGGFPFGLLVFLGAQRAPAAHIGVFMAGSMPIFTAILGRVFLHESIDASRWLGFGTIFAGIAWLAASAGRMSSASAGDLFLVAAAIAWAAHTHAFRHSGLDALEGAALVNGWSALGLALIVPWFGLPGLFAAPWRDVAAQALGQGLFAGLVGLAAYMTAVARLGSARASLSAALVPPMTALGGALWLGEPAGTEVFGASLAVACGIAFASGALSFRQAGLWVTLRR